METPEVQSISEWQRQVDIQNLKQSLSEWSRQEGVQSISEWQKQGDVQSRIKRLSGWSIKGNIESMAREISGSGVMDTGERFFYGINSLESRPAIVNGKIIYEHNLTEEALMTLFSIAYSEMRPSPSYA